MPAPLESIGQNLSNSLIDYYKKYPQEKIFVHTDQNVYFGGQTIWYKAYVLAYGKPSQLSKILYVRLSDSHGKLIKWDKHPVLKSTAHGNINLPDSLPTGLYQLQAFTAWMLNFDKDGLYHQNIYVQNVRDTANHAIPVGANKRYHINFFPEGGELVEGNVCSVAFKAADGNGMPIVVSGDVIDNNKNILAKLATVHDGMGSFKLEPYASTSYSARVYFPDKSVQNIALPMAKKTGISMQVSISLPEELEIKINYADEKKGYNNIILSAMQNNGLAVNYPLQLSHGTNIFSFQKNKFSTGILRLTIFDATGLPTAERIVFINNNDQLRLSLAKDSISFNPKGKNVFTLHLSDNKNRPTKANVSISVTDANIGTEPENDISSYFLLSSELVDIFISQLIILQTAVTPCSNSLIW